ncbi:unnamed protein product [Taenia asiatica]|uniref:Dystrobrevin alpha n=1 Tax=Taenia asiatica TaxID=60517 RepID=A0A0R3W957_TAEAS|nr:unnamed protein product [Taenia asiatica]
MGAIPAMSRPDATEGSLGGDPADPESIDALQSQLEDLFESLRQRRGNFFRFGKRSSPHHHRIDLLEKVPTSIRFSIVCISVVCLCHGHRAF